MVIIRVILGALSALLVVVIAVPAVVLLDLVAGGTGLGLCTDGLGSCETPFYTLLELLLILTGVAFVLGVGVAACLRALSKPRRYSGS